MLLSDRPRRDPQQVAAIKRWAVELLGIPADSSLLVTELECHEEGCPPLETVVAVLAEGEPPRQWKLHKPVAEVTREDLETLVTGGPSKSCQSTCSD
jgi:hypothetical protein